MEKFLNLSIGSLLSQPPSELLDKILFIRVSLRVILKFFYIIQHSFKFEIIIISIKTSFGWKLIHI